MTIADNLKAVKQRMAAASRLGCLVNLLAVSKTFSAQSVREAALAGQRAFGENYAQEGADKIKALSDLDLEWHFIGPLQRNKAKLVAEYFDWMHSVDRFAIAERLSLLRPADRLPLQICLQVNVSGEDSKSGVSPDDVLALARQVSILPNLRLRGLMAIPEPTDDVSLLSARFALLRQLKERLNEAGFSMDTLSMGMSDDMETAIQEGSTLVRVGSAIFGYRPRKPVVSITSEGAGLGERTKAE